MAVFSFKEQKATPLSPFSLRHLSPFSAFWISPRLAVIGGKALPLASAFHNTD